MPFGRLRFGFVPVHPVQRRRLALRGDHCVEAALGRPLCDPVGVVLTSLGLVGSREILRQCRNAAVRSEERGDGQVFLVGQTFERRQPVTGMRVADQGDMLRAVSVGALGFARVRGAGPAAVRVSFGLVLLRRGRFHLERFHSLAVRIVLRTGQEDPAAEAGVWVIQLGLEFVLILLDEVVRDDHLAETEGDDERHSHSGEAEGLL